MPFYANTEQLYACLKVLFERIHSQDQGAARAVSGSRLVIRLRCTSPAAEVTIDGRQRPPRVHYNKSALRPELDVELTADVLHQILLAELPLGKALSSGQMKVRGPLLKTVALEEVLRRGQALYPQVLREQGLDGHLGASRGTNTR